MQQHYCYGIFIKVYKQVQYMEDGQGQDGLHQLLLKDFQGRQTIP